MRGAVRFARGLMRNEIRGDRVNRVNGDDWDLRTIKMVTDKFPNGLIGLIGLIGLNPNGLIGLRTIRTIKQGYHFPIFPIFPISPINST